MVDQYQIIFDAIIAFIHLLISLKDIVQLLVGILLPFRPKKMCN